MGLHEELTADSPLSGCKVCHFLVICDEDPNDWVRELAQPTSLISHTAVVKALKRRGVEVSENSVARHRRNHAS